MQDDTKICTRCSAAKLRTEFSKRSSTPDGLRYQCRACDAADRRACADRSNETRRAWRAANGDHERQTERARYARHADRERERKRNWVRDNPDGAKAIAKRSRDRYPGRNGERARRWREANPESVSEYARRYRLENHVEVRRRTKEWKQANYGIVLEHMRRRRARLLGAVTVAFTADQLFERMSMFAGCWVCGGPKQAVDHVKPLGRGGAHMLANLRPICDACNSSKKDRWPVPTTLRRLQRQPSTALPAA